MVFITATAWSSTAVTRDEAMRSQMLANYCIISFLETRRMREEAHAGEGRNQKNTRPHLKIEHPQHEYSQGDQNPNTRPYCCHNVKYQCDVHEFVIYLVKALLSFGEEGNVVGRRIVLGLGEVEFDLAKGFEFC
jgi:hypothetical protein